MSNEEIIERKDRKIYVFRHENYEYRCLSASKARELAKDSNWTHTATIDLAVILEIMLNGTSDPSDVLDEISFSPKDKPIKSFEIQI